mgnify:CR=1 FL=1
MKTTRVVMVSLCVLWCIGMTSQAEETTKKILGQVCLKE